MRRSGPRRCRSSRRPSCPVIPAARSRSLPRLGAGFEHASGIRLGFLLTACVRGDNRGSKGVMSTRPAVLTLAGVLMLVAAAAPPGIAQAFEVVLSAQGE